MKKTYVLDTNVLLSDSNSINSFEENDVIIPLAVLEELDRHKTRQDEIGANARDVNRKLDDLRKIGSLLDGIPTIGGGLLKVATINETNLSRLPIELQTTKVDNQIIAFVLAQKNDTTVYVLVSKDINVRIKCDSLGIKCEDYRKSQIVVSKVDELYSGVVCYEATQEFIAQIYAEQDQILAPTDWSLHPNQIVIIKQYGLSSGSTIVRAIKTAHGYVLRLISSNDNCFGLKPRNKEQNFSLDLLYDDSIKLVTLSGLAGSGKSLLALAAGLDQNTIIGSKKKYSKLVIARSLQPVGKDTGFLPGTLLEKLAPWQGPTIDNLNYLMNSNVGKQIYVPRKNNKNQIDSQQIDPYLSILLEKGVIEIASISHIRGRSIPNSFVIIEEAQNLSLGEIKTIITRVGEGTKIILVGDIDQIDNTYVDKYSNGLTHVIEKFKDCDLSAHVTLIKGERSSLATYAANLL